MSSYLLRRAGGTYHFRRGIPVDLRPRFGGRREWLRSLGTKNREEAKRLLASYVVAFDTAMEAARASLDDGPMQVVVPAPDYRVVLHGGIQRHSSPPASRSRTVPLLATFNAYAEEQGIKPSTATEWRAIIKGLIAFLGHDDARRLVVDDLDRWRDTLLLEFTKRGKLRDPRTVKDKYISVVRATLNWAIEKRRLSHNVAGLVVVRVPKKPKLRDRGFTNFEAHAILRETLQEQPANLLPTTILAQRWIPWLCAYSGARVNEMSQLRGSDVYKIDDIWVMRITPEAGTVKANQARVVPLHPHIVEQGFPSIAISKTNDPIFYNPQRIRAAGPANRYYKKVGERLRDWVRNDIGIVDPNVQPNHGWRHTFKTIAFEAEIPERIADAIQGHAPRSVGQTYGSISVPVLAKAIAKIPRFIIEG